MEAKDFHFPFEPYSIQRQFMIQVYQAIADGKVAILESPTGTGKSLSLACSALTWLRDHQKQAVSQNVEHANDPDEPSWIIENARQEKLDRLLAARKAREARFSRARAREAASQKHQSQGSGPSKRQLLHDIRTVTVEGNASIEFMLDDYFSDDERQTKSTRDASALSGLSIETQRLLDKVGMGGPSVQPSYDDEAGDDSPIVYFCSRTHSQLTQFASEVRKITLPPVIDEEPETPRHSSDASASETLRHMTLGSRKNLCLNPAVSRLKSNTAINERCLELQRPGVVEDQKCTYLPKPEDTHIVNKFVDHSHAKIRDIEDLATLGKAMSICPYYASRKAVATSELITLPYPLLLQRSSREALGISLKDNVVIVDEAHNLMDAICGLFSCSVSLSQLRLGRGQLMTYLQKFKSMLKGKNRVYITQCVRVLDSLIVFAQGLLDRASAHEGVCETTNMLSGKGIDQINLFKLNDYIQKSKLARKVDGYTDFLEETTDISKTSGAKVDKHRSIPTLMIIQSFMMALMNCSKEGRFGYIVNNGTVTLKYMLLDPTAHFRDIVDEARAVILAGGTMSPMDDYYQYLFPYLDSTHIRTLSCRHIVPATSLEVFSVAKSGKDVDFDFKFASRSNKNMIAAAGHALIDFVSVIPDGVVAFFPSYAYLEQCVTLWKSLPSKSDLQSANRGTIWQALGKTKPIFFETNSQTQHAANHFANEHESTRNVVVTGTALQSFTTCVKEQKGGLLFAVISGSLSEGINFSDELGRGIVVFGLPYPNPNSAEWKAKMDYIVQKSEAKPHTNAAKISPAQEFYENATMRAVNQAVGRAIRHRRDYAAILLVDRRYATDRVRRKLPLWMRESIQAVTDAKTIPERLQVFFDRQRASNH